MKVKFRATMSKHNLFMIMTAMLAKVNLTRVVNSTAMAKADVTKGCTLQGIVTFGGYYAHKIRRKMTNFILIDSHEL